MSAQHTPGPWHVISTREDELKVKGPEDEWVCDCADGFWSDETDAWIMADDSKANAALIAAAPELLEALEWFAGLARFLPPDMHDAEFCDQDEVVLQAGHLRRAAAAIAKARGQ